jgi:hypothetical protein
VKYWNFWLRNPHIVNLFSFWKFLNPFPRGGQTEKTPKPTDRFDGSSVVTLSWRRRRGSLRCGALVAGRRWTWRVSLNSPAPITEPIRRSRRSSSAAPPPELLPRRPRRALPLPGWCAPLPTAPSRITCWGCGAVLSVPHGQRRFAFCKWCRWKYKWWMDLLWSMDTSASGFCGLLC